MKVWIFFDDRQGSCPAEAAAAQSIATECRKFGHEAEVLNPNKFELIVSAEKKWQALYEGKIMPTPDIIVPRTGSETSYQAHVVMHFFETRGIPFLNCPATVQIVGDKLKSQQVLAAGGIPVPKTMLGTFPANVDLVEKELGFPVVVKTLSGTRGGGVFLCETRDKFKDLTDLIAEANPNAPFIFQEYIGTSHGRDIRVFVVNGKVHGCMERRSVDGSFKSNVSRGGQGSAFKMTQELERLALRTANLLNMEVAGIDFLFCDKNGYKVCEANSAPGFAIEHVCMQKNPPGRLLAEAAIRKAIQYNDPSRKIIRFVRESFRPKLVTPKGKIAV